MRDTDFSHRRVLIVGADGLRPDQIDPAVMPNLAALAETGVRFNDHHAVYPSHTRVNMSALASGTTPGRHGIVANTMIVPGATDDHVIDTSSYQHIDALGRFSNDRVLHVPTLGDFLPDGGRVAVAGTGSGGSNLLWTHKNRGRIVNTTTAFGIADLYDLREKLGEIPAAGSPNIPRTRYAARAVTEIFLDDPDNRVIVLWLNEPDASLHRFGIGAPEVSLALAGVDTSLGDVLAAMDARGIRDAFDIFFISDHGHSTVTAHKTLREYLTQAAHDLGRDLPPLTTASDYIYAAPGTDEPSTAELAPLVEWLLAQAWCDIVMAGRDDLDALPGVLLLRAAWNGSLTPRRPLLAVSPRWTHDPNEHGVPGTVASLTTQSALKSSHGSLSPYDMHALLIGNGPSFRSGLVSNLPTGAIDLMPTILSLMGRPLPANLDGRVLWEGLASPAGEPGHVSTAMLAPRIGSVGRERALIVHRVGTTTYVHG